VRPLKILITGIGITGKSTVRKRLYKIITGWYHAVEHFDCDYDRKKLPIEFSSEKIYLIEDVHGPAPNAVSPLKSFNFIFYLLPCPFTHLCFWLSRMIIWYKEGKFSWDADVGTKGKWKGSGKKYDIKNLLPILKEFWQDWKNRRNRIDEDLCVIKKTSIPTIIVIPKKKGGKILFSINC